MARFLLRDHRPDREEDLSSRLSYYELADGKIVEDDAITTPEFAQAFADRMPPPSSD